MSNNPYEDAIRLFESECSDDEGRKHFFRNGGAQRAEALIAQLDALRRRAQPFVRAS